MVFCIIFKLGRLTHDVHKILLSQMTPHQQFLDYLRFDRLSVPILCFLLVGTNVHSLKTLIYTLKFPFPRLQSRFEPSTSRFKSHHSILPRHSDGYSFGYYQFEKNLNEKVHQSRYSQFNKF